MNLVNFIITPSARQRIEEMRAQKNNPALMLRIMVEGGGCSGFKYTLSFDTQKTDDDTVLENLVLIDSVSRPFIEGSTLNFVTDLMGQDFKITNPNAVASCGCGVSFAV